MIITPQSLRGIYIGFNTIFNKALEEAKPLYTEVATITPSATDSETYAWLNDIPSMREWVGEREVQNISASGYTIRAIGEKLFANSGKKRYNEFEVKKDVKH